MVTSIITALLTWFITTIIVGFCLPFVAYCFNTIVASRFTNFDELVTLIPSIFNSESPVKLGSIIIGIGITLLAITLVYALIKSMTSTISGKEEENPGSIIIYTLIAGIGILLYQPLMDLFTSFLNAFTAVGADGVSLIGGQIEKDSLSWLGGAIAGIPFSPKHIFIVIIIVSIAMSSFGAALTFVERYITLSVFILLGPICLAFYPNRDTRPVFNEWLRGLLSQSFVMIISMFMVKIVSLQLAYMGKNFGGIDDMFGHTQELLINLIIVLALLGLVKNSEKFAQEIGFKTMPNMDSARSFLGAIGTTAGLAYAGFRTLKPGIGKRVDSASQRLGTQDVPVMGPGGNQFSDARDVAKLKADGDNETYRLEMFETGSNRIKNAAVSNTPIGQQIKTPSIDEFAKRQMAYGVNPYSPNGILMGNRSINGYGLSKDTKEAYEKFAGEIESINSTRRNISSNIKSGISNNTIGSKTSKTVSGDAKIDDNNKLDISPKTPPLVTNTDLISEAYGLKEYGIEPIPDTLTDISDPEMKKEGCAMWKFEADVEGYNGNKEKQEMIMFATPNESTEAGRKVNAAEMMNKYVGEKNAFEGNEKTPSFFLEKNKMHTYDNGNLAIGVVGKHQPTIAEQVSPIIDKMNENTKKIVDDQLYGDVETTPSKPSSESHSNQSLNFGSAKNGADDESDEE